MNRPIFRRTLTISVHSETSHITAGEEAVEFVSLKRDSSIVRDHSGNEREERVA